jgi:hypothetical protein
MAALLRISVVTALLSFLGSGLAVADRFAPVPGAGKARKNLKMKFVRYDGSTNGRMVVDVKNSGKRSAAFSAKGVYFVPEGDPEKAPQRLGAAGPIMVVDGAGNEKQYREQLVVRPGQTVRVQLEVFCIDSHRSSPSNSTRFKVARKLLPEKLRREINAGARRILRKNKGDVARSKSAIQSHMWKTRDKDWIPIEGERKNEKAAPPQQRRTPRRRHRRIQQQKTPL